MAPDELPDCVQHESIAAMLGGSTVLTDDAEPAPMTDASIK
jgi:hypothetical protein